MYPDGSVVTYSAAETIANVKNPRATYLTADDVDVERLERGIHKRFLSLEERERIHDLRSGGSSVTPEMQVRNHNDQSSAAAGKLTHLIDPLGLLHPF